MFTQPLCISEDKKLKKAFFKRKLNQKTGCLIRQISVGYHDILNVRSSTGKGFREQAKGLPS